MCRFSRWRRDEVRELFSSEFNAYADACAELAEDMKDN